MTTHAISRQQIRAIARTDGYIELRSLSRKADNSTEFIGRRFIHVNGSIDGLDDTLAWADAQSRNGNEVYVGVNLRDKPGGKKEDVTNLTACFADLDLEGERIEEARNALLSAPIPPNKIVHSGYGLHAWWLTGPSQDKALWLRVQRSIAAYFKEYAIDSDISSDEARILRLAPYPNRKHGKVIETQLIYCDETTPTTLEALAAAYCRDDTPASTSRTFDTTQGQTVEDNWEAYAQKAFADELAILARTKHPGRNIQLNKSAFALAQFFESKLLDESTVKSALEGVAKSIGLDPREIQRTIQSGFEDGRKEPRKLQKVSKLARRVDPETGEIRDDPRPVIQVQNLDLPAVTAQAWNAIVAANTPPTVFRRGGELVRLETLEDGSKHVVSVDARRMTGILSRTARWIRVSPPDKNGVFHEKDVVPPGAVVDDALVNTDPRIPPLTRIVHAPVFAPDGILLDSPGYHKSARLFYDPRPGTKVPPVPADPTTDDIARAKNLILDELLGEFPFVSDADKAHAVAQLFLPFVRACIKGPTPLHLIEAPIHGSGKGLLAKVLIQPSTGILPTPMAEASNDEEWRKRLTSVLLGAPTTVVFDNVTRPLDSGALAAALTTEVWSDRLLGKSEHVHVPVTCTWVATANNATLSGEMSRRCLRIRVDPKIDKPWQREGFKHPRLEEWADAHRGELIWAALVLCRYGLQHGTPGRVLGSYEAWADVMGRILNGVEIPGFLDNLDALYEAADAEGAAWRALCGAWWEAHQDDPQLAADLFSLAADTEGELKVYGKDDTARRKSFGKALARVRDRVFSIHANGEDMRVQVVDAGEFRRAKRWKLVRVSIESFVSFSPPYPAHGKTQLDINVTERIEDECEKTHNTHKTHTVETAEPPTIIAPWLAKRNTAKQDASPDGICVGGALIEGVTAEEWEDWCTRFATGDKDVRNKLADEIDRRGFYLSEVWPLLEQTTAQGVQHG